MALVEEVYLEGLENFTVVVDGTPTKVEVRKLCSIDVENLVEELTKHPSNYAWYATVLALFDAKKDDLAHQIDVYEGELDIEIRRRVKGDKDAEKELKERFIKSQILTDAKHKVLSDEYLDTSKVVKRLTALVKALETKRDMMVQIGARLRKEMDMNN